LRPILDPAARTAAAPAPAADAAVAQGHDDGAAELTHCGGRNRAQGCAIAYVEVPVVGGNQTVRGCHGAILLSVKRNSPRQGATPRCGLLFDFPRTEEEVLKNIPVLI